jgi:hypothetical protein
MINSDNVFPVVAVSCGALVMVAAGLIIAFKPNPPDQVRDLILGGTGLAALGGTAYKYTDPSLAIKRRATRKAPSPPKP